MSVRVNLISMIKDALRRPAKSTAKTEAPQSEAAQTQPDETASAEVEAIKQRIAEVEEPAAPSEPEKAEITDFHIKTEDEILADAKRLEDEVAKRNATYDPAAALEERRRRLLGDKADQS